MLRVDYAVTCWQGSHLGMVAYAVVMSLIYPIGTPLLYWRLLRRHHTVIRELDAAKRGATDAARAADPTAVPSQTDSRERLPAAVRKLTDGYELRCYWFEVFECGRKLALVGLPVFLPIGSAAQLICGLMVCFLSFGMYASYDPYVAESDDRLAKVCQTALFFSLVSAIAIKMERDSSAEALGVLLIFTLAVPPVLAFVFHGDVQSAALDLPSLCSRAQERIWPRRKDKSLLKAQKAEGVVWDALKV